MMQVNQLLDKIKYSYSDILRENLVGIYLHGSLAMNCFNPLLSDIDFIVVVSYKPSDKELRELVNLMLELTDGPDKGFEMSVLTENDTKNFKYPTPFILHYSDKYKSKYISQTDYICGDSTDVDLAAHITVIRERGICLTGKPIDEVFRPVPKKFYVDSIMNDVMDSKKEIIDNPIYYILNLCRILCFLISGKICSKKEGGEWFKLHSPKYCNIIESALNSYIYNCKFNIDNKSLIEFAEYMLNEIDLHMNINDDI
ncbi:aminoglycoside adenylyltransferase domain-containing protein [Sedimentibacter sp.]|uniref:aminoglycoside adenylyltransferase domain-containing protein n=1 Tax=Sedimentibacter sp. TaxID=1960295 RepID=UPI0028AD23E8|nr:aminoglycoside adenylyltransferase domain-containing protein [Sedimentibacter sp.]